MLAKAPVGQGKGETKLMLCCDCQQSQTAPWQELSVRINCVLRLLGAAVLICRAAKDLQLSCLQLDGGAGFLEMCPRDLKSSPWLVTELYNQTLVPKGLGSKSTEKNDWAERWLCWNIYHEWFTVGLDYLSVLSSRNGSVILQLMWVTMWSTNKVTSYFTGLHCGSAPTVTVS